MFSLLRLTLRVITDNVLFFLNYKCLILLFAWLLNIRNWTILLITKYYKQLEVRNDIIYFVCNIFRQCKYQQNFAFMRITCSPNWGDLSIDAKVYLYIFILRICFTINGVYFLEVTR